MSSKTSVVIGELKSKSNELSELNASFKAAVSQLESLEGALNAMWEGEANDTFHAAFNNDKEQMLRFYDEINKYITVLDMIASRYAAAEANNVEIARTRSYR